MNESGLWEWLRDRLPPGAFTRIESPSSPGVPDVNYALEISSTHVSYIQGWIELKIGGPGRYPMQGERRGLRKAQELWIRRHIELGVPVAIIALIDPLLVVWRLKPEQVKGFNALDRDALLRIAAYSIQRSKMRSLPFHLLI